QRPLAQRLCAGALAGHPVGINADERALPQRMKGAQRIGDVSVLRHLALKAAAEPRCAHKVLERGVVIGFERRLQAVDERRERVERYRRRRLVRARRAWSGRAWGDRGTFLREVRDALASHQAEQSEREKGRASETPATGQKRAEGAGQQRTANEA